MSKQEIAEQVIRGLLTAVGPKTFAYALANASFHGDVFRESEFTELDDDQLAAWYDAVDNLAVSVQLIETAA